MICQTFILSQVEIKRIPPYPGSNIHYPDSLKWKNKNLFCAQSASNLPLSQSTLHNIKRQMGAHGWIQMWFLTEPNVMGDLPVSLFD